ncbi:MAG TPA: hypothetical protein VIJ85_06770 [Rhizomicrobium sp.]
MLGKFGYAAVALLVSAMPAWAQGTCGSAPFAPAAIDGSKANEQQMKDAHDDVMNFMKASDDFQSCLLADLTRQKDEAAKAKTPKPLDPSVEAGVNKSVDDNQRMKEKVGAEFNAAVAGYKAAHPK